MPGGWLSIGDISCLTLQYEPSGLWDYHVYNRLGQALVLDYFMVAIIGTGSLGVGSCYMFVL